MMYHEDDHEDDHENNSELYEQFTNIEIRYHQGGEEGEGGGGLGGIPSFVAVRSCNDDDDDDDHSDEEESATSARIKNGHNNNKDDDDDGVIIVISSSPSDETTSENEKGRRSSSSPIFLSRIRNNKKQQQGRRQRPRSVILSKIKKFLYNNIEFKWLKFIQILCGMYILIVTFTYSGSLGIFGGARDSKTGFIIDPNNDENTRNGIIEYINPVFMNGNGNGATVSRAIVASSTTQMVLLGLSVCMRIISFVCGLPTCLF
jgi:hypothetical protein